MNIGRRTVLEAKYMIETGNTVRQIARVFGVSKSTVHKDLSERLLKVDCVLYARVRDILEYHREIRHIKGGEATKKKYLNLAN